MDTVTESIESAALPVVERSLSWPTRSRSEQHDVDHDHPLLRCGPPPLALAALRRGTPGRIVLHGGPGVPQRQYQQDPARSLVPPSDRSGRLHHVDDLAVRSVDSGRQANPSGLSLCTTLSSPKIPASVLAKRNRACRSDEPRRSAYHIVAILSPGCSRGSLPRVTASRCGLSASTPWPATHYQSRSR